MTGWDKADQPNPPRYRIVNVFLFTVRFLAMGLIIYGLLVLFLLVRLLEWPWRKRAFSPFITQWVCHLSLKVMGLKVNRLGQQLKTQHVIVSNHVSWLDIFVHNSLQPTVFVAKSEISEWVGIALLAKATGTVFIKRDPRDAIQQSAVIVERLRRGDPLLFFPEGTSTDGLRVLKFKSTLFASFLAPDVRKGLQIQPVTLRYCPEADLPPSFYGFWGDETLASSLFKVLGSNKNGTVDYIYHRPLKVTDFTDRKELALACESLVRDGLAQANDGVSAQTEMKPISDLNTG